MSLTRAAIEKNRVTLVMMAVVFVAGLNAYSGMPRAEDPGFIVRTALVQTRFPGASPQRVEQLVTSKLEEVIQEIPQLESVVSQSKTGVSIILVNIQESYTDMRPIWDDLRRKVERVRADLPDGAIGPLVNDEFGDVFGSVLTMTGDGFDLAELEDRAEDLRDELLRVPDVSKVEIYGAQDERIYVEYSNARLAELGLSPLRVRSVLEARNIVSPGGDLRTPFEQIVIEPTGNYESVDDVASTLVPLPTGDLVPLRDVARVYRATFEPARAKVRAGGEPALALALAMRDGGNILDLGAQVRARVDRVRAETPVGIEFHWVVFQADAVDRKVRDFVGNLVQAVVIVIAVMLFTLGPRTGLVVASLIPMAIVATFLFLPMVNVGIDQMSLAALIIALGLLVDNAIVMSESILVQMEEGKSALQAAVDSADELRIPLLTSSLTTAAAFLPIFLAESAVGEYTGSLFKVVTITLLSSWVISLTLIPLLCVQFLRVEVRTAGTEEDGGTGDGENKASGLWARVVAGYRWALVTALRRPVLATVGMLALFVGSMALFRQVPVIFFPDNDRPTLTAEIYLPIGSPLAATERAMDRLDAFFHTLAVSEDESGDASESGEAPSGLTDWVTYLGEGGPRFYLSHSPEQASPHYAISILNATDRAFVDRAVVEIERFVTGQLPGVDVRVQPLANGPGVGHPIEVRVSGRDEDRVFEWVDTVKAQLRQMPGITYLTDDWGARSKKVVVEIDEARAQRAGVSHQDVAVSLQTLFSGLEATQYREGEDVIPVVLRSEEARDLRTREIGSLNVFSQATGRSVPVTQVAEPHLEWQPANIRRRDQLRTVTVQAGLAPGVTAAQINAQLQPWLDARDWPLGYGYELGGEDEASATANQSIADKLPVAGLLIVLLLVSQFNSLRKPAIILLTIPLGLIGVVLGLLVFRSYFGFMTLLGVVSLAGIVINNAIVLLDRIQLELDQGAEPARAIIESGVRRLRPILLTTLTTLGGMVPLYLGGGPMFEPMAVAIMSGLVFATVLTLGMVPVFYALFYGVRATDESSATS